MSIEKHVTLVSIELSPANNTLFARYNVEIREDGVPLATSSHVETLDPGAAIDRMDDKVCVIAAAAWTAEIVAEAQQGWAPEDVADYLAQLSGGAG